MSQNIRKIERVSITDQVVKEIRRLIISGTLKVGEKLPSEHELCEQLGVGRSSVREAFRVLAALGMVDISPGKGAFVRRAHDNTYETIKDWFVEKHAEVSELIEVRMAVEPLALRLAIRRASEDEVRQISEIQNAFKAAVQANDVIELATLDESFHTSIIEASGNRLLIKIGRLLADSMREFRTRSFAVQENAGHATVPHDKIVKAIIERDEAAGSEAMMYHLEVSLDDMEKVVRH